MQTFRDICGVVSLGALILLGTVGAPAFAQDTAAPGRATGGVESKDILGLYILNPLDEIMISIYGGDKNIDEYRKIINSDGSVYIPFVEQDVKLAGISVLDAEAMLEDLARSYIKEPRIVLTILSSYSQSVSTYGMIDNVTVELNTPMRILQLIAQVGGPHEHAVTDEIRVISTDGTVRYFDYETVNKNPTSEENFHLRPGDIVYVPGEDAKSVMVFGSVASPGVYGLSAEGRLLDVILKAGSWDTDADLGNVRVVRELYGSKTVVEEVDIQNIFDGGETDRNIVLNDGDMVYVPVKRTAFWLSTTSGVLNIIYTILTAIVVYRNLSD